MLKFLKFYSTTAINSRPYWIVNYKDIAHQKFEEFTKMET